jgi:hypothetical protein
MNSIYCLNSFFLFEAQFCILLGTKKTKKIPSKIYLSKDFCRIFFNWYASFEFDISEYDKWIIHQKTVIPIVFFNISPNDADRNWTKYW